MGVGAALDSNVRFGDMEMFGEKFDESGVSFTVVRFGAEIDCVLFGCGFDNFFLAGAGFDSDF